MTARSVALTAALTALFAVSGCFRPREPEQASPPRPQGEKTKADLLVGMWNLVKHDQEAVDPQAGIAAEFTKDGTFIFESTDPTVHAQRSTGRYTLNGDILRLTTVTDTDGPAGKSWDVVIVRVTESELVTDAGPLNGRQRSVLKRAEGK